MVAVVARHAEKSDFSAAERAHPTNERNKLENSVCGTSGPLLAFRDMGSARQIQQPGGPVCVCGRSERTSIVWRAHALASNIDASRCVGKRYSALHVTIASGRVRLATDGGAKIAR